MKETKLLTTTIAFILVIGLSGCNTSNEEYNQLTANNVTNIENALNQSEEISYYDDTSLGCDHIWSNTYVVSSIDSRYHTRTCTLCGEILAEPHQASDDDGHCAYCEVSGLNTEGLTYTQNGNEYTVTAYNMNLTAYDVYIPAIHEGLPVTAIGVETASKKADTICASGSTSNYLEFISIPDTVKVINPYALSNCLSLQTVNIPESVETIANDAFDGDYKLVRLTGNPIGLTTISEKAFYDCYSLSEVTIPGGVVEVGDSAFQNCHSLQTLVVKEGVERLSTSAFEACYSLTNIYLPSSLKRLENQAFRSCYGLKFLELPEGLESVGESVFWQCYSLEEISLPSTLIGIGNTMFNACYALKTVIVADGVEEIGTQAFFQCYSLTTIDLPESVRTLSSQAFSDCVSLSEIELPGSIQTIESYVFQNCYSLREVTFNEGLSNIGQGAFMGSGLKSITLPYSVKVVEGSAFNNCYNLQTIKILGRLRYIGSNAFGNDSSLKLIELPEGVYTIYSNAFDNSGLTSIVIPSSLIVVANNAFAGCYNLKNVFYNGTFEQWNKLINDEGNFGSGNDALINARIYYYDDSGTIENGWHYVNDTPTPW